MIQLQIYTLVESIIISLEILKTTQVLFGRSIMKLN